MPAATRWTARPCKKGRSPAKGAPASSRPSKPREPRMDGSEVDSPWKPQLVTEGAWAGWKRYDTDPFENLTGPFYCRQDETGRMVCAFRAEKKHMNAGGAMHGGCMASFADYAIFMLADQELEGSGSVTASLTTEFLDAAYEGELV